MKFTVQRYRYRQRDKKGLVKKDFDTKFFDITIEDGANIDGSLTFEGETAEASWLSFRDILMAGSQFGAHSIDFLPDKEEQMPTDKKYWSKEE